MIASITHDNHCWGIEPSLIYEQVSLNWIQSSRDVRQIRLEFFRAVEKVVKARLVLHKLDNGCFVEDGDSCVEKTEDGGNFSDSQKQLIVVEDWARMVQELQIPRFFVSRNFFKIFWVVAFVSNIAGERLKRQCATNWRIGTRSFDTCKKDPDCQY